MFYKSDFGASFGVIDVGMKGMFHAMGMSDRDIYYAESMLSALPFFGSFYQARDKVSYMDDYLDNRGLSYGDIKYPSMTAGYQGVSGLANYVSSNIERLYR